MDSRNLLIGIAGSAASAVLGLRCSRVLCYRRPRGSTGRRVRGMSAMPPHVDGLDRDLLLALAAVAVQRRNIAGPSFRRPTRDETDQRPT